MRILVDATAVDPGPSGARTRLVNLLGEYVRLDGAHDVAVMAPRGNDLAGELIHRGVECAQCEPAPPPLQRWRTAARFHRTMLRRFKADCVQGETLPVPRGAAPRLLTIHDLRDLEGAASRGSLARAFYARWLLPDALQRVSRVIAVSEDTASVIASRCRFPRDRISVVPNAPDPGVKRDDDAERTTALRARLGLPSRCVVAIGHLEPRKNLALLIDAVRRLRADSRFHEVGVVLSGRDEVGEGERLRALAARNPSVPLVSTGPLTAADRNTLLGVAECVVTPSLVEGFGLVPLEAMAAGVPVIVARSRALPEVAGDAALLCDPHDPADLARQLARLLDDESLRRESIARGLRRAAEFTWRRSAEALRVAHDEVFRGSDFQPLPSCDP